MNKNFISIIVNSEQNHMSCLKSGFIPKSNNTFFDDKHKAEVKIHEENFKNVTETYTESGDLPLVSHGVYGACRHPGFWLFAVFYFFLWLFFTGRQLFWAFLLYPTCNYLYICVQDRYIFPQYIAGYDDYKRSVPFLLPTGESIRKAFFH